MLIGETIGPYRVLAKLGEGGMGVVYRARDTKLDRDVALKILPDAFASDPERLARFEREAKTLAALNHPHIAQIYGLDHSSGTNALVMELVEGEDLSQRIARGPIPLDEAVPIAKQIVDALEAAHEQGIIHRDLKPANIKVRSDGTVKVLDFGLAKATQEAGGAGQADRVGRENVLNSPTITSPAMTLQGVILGTAAYMSPEQAKGKPADKRSDIWAFGCVLYEMLTGTRAFEGDDVSDTLAHVLARSPDWSALPASMPSPLHRLLRRCLQKERRERLADIADARLDLADAAVMQPADSAATGASMRRLRTWERTLWAAAVLLAVASVGYLNFRSRPAAPSPLKTSITLPADVSLAYGSVPMVAPDGRSIAFVAVQRGTTQVWVRPLDSVVPRPVAGTEGGTNPFWSPDSRSIAFFADGNLKRVDVAGGVAMTLCEARPGRGGTWGTKGVIVFTSSVTGPLYRVNASGGKAERVPQLATGAEISHRSPSFLPDGDHFLFAATDGNTTSIHLARLSSGERKPLLNDAVSAQYVAPGYLLYWRDGTLAAQAFDPATFEVVGDALPLAENVDSASDGLTGTAVALFSASHSGVILAYTSGRMQPGIRIAWFDRSGKELGDLGFQDDVRWPSIAPDGSSVVFSRRNVRTGFYELWLHDMKLGTQRRLTTMTTANANWPVWSPDSTRVAFNSVRDGSSSLFVQRTQGGAKEEVLLAGARGLPMDWSGDGRHVLYQFASGGETGMDIWALPMGGQQKPFPFVNDRPTERRSRISPDGRWVAYLSDETTRFEIYVQSFPTPSRKWTITSSGAGSPVWSRDGSELFFMAPGGQLMSVAVKAGDTFEAQPPRALFQVKNYYEMDTWFDVSADGRFLVPVVASNPAAAIPISVWANWIDELQQRALAR